MDLLAIYSDNLCFKWKFEWKNLSKMGRFYGLTGRLGEMKRNGRSSRRMGRVSRFALDSELKLYLLIWILNIITRNTNFEKLDTGEMWYQILLYFSLTDNRCFQELSSEEESQLEDVLKTCLEEVLETNKICNEDICI